MTRKALFTLICSMIGIIVVAASYMKPPIHLRQYCVLVVYIVMHFWLVRRYRHEGRKTARIVWSLILAYLWVYSSHGQSLRTLGAMHWLLLMLTGVSIAFTLYLAISELRRPFEKSAEAPKRRWMLLYAAIPFIGWLPYFLAFYPGKMNADSFWQWAQAHHVTPYTAWHPIVHTWIIQLMSSIYNSPASYVILQMLILSFTIAYALYVLQSYGAPITLVVLLDLMYALNPANGFLSITVWKDIPFAAAILLLTVYFAKITVTPDWLTRPRNMVCFAITCLFAMTLRHNGPEAVIAALVVAILLLRALRRRLMVITIPVLLAYFIFNGPVLGAFNVVKYPLNEALGVPSQQIAATYKAHGKFTPELKSYFDRILPASNWAKDYVPWTVNPVKWDLAYNQNAIYASFSSYLKNWAKLFELNPKIFIRAYMGQTAVIWQFKSLNGMNPYLDTPTNLQDYPLYVRIRAPKVVATPSATPVSTIEETYLAYVQYLKASFPNKPVPSYAQFQERIQQTIDPLQTKPVSKKLNHYMNDVFFATKLNWQNYFVKGTLAFFALLMSLVAAFMRFGRRGLVPYLPPLFALITFAVAIPATDFRYSFSYVLSASFLLFFGKFKTADSDHVHQKR